MGHEPRPAVSKWCAHGGGSTGRAEERRALPLLSLMLPTQGLIWANLIAFGDELVRVDIDCDLCGSAPTHARSRERSNPPLFVLPKILAAHLEFRRPTSIGQRKAPIETLASQDERAQFWRHQAWCVVGFCSSFLFGWLAVSNITRSSLQFAVLVTAFQVMLS
jgi:hypothetical protein